jgi:hypothetical protein
MISSNNSNIFSEELSRIFMNFAKNDLKNRKSHLKSFKEKEVAEIKYVSLDTII